ncbi:MAG: DUF1641 domain-containing protein [Chloroflexales bacterium]|nr:DUF1641 domain-containing protein [Chloroflexales bacterium]
MSTTSDTYANGRQDAAGQLLDRLNEPRTSEALNRLLDHAELLAYSVSSLDSFLRRGEVIIDNVATSVADIKRELPIDRVPDSAQLERLVAQLPQLIEAANRLAELTKRPEFQNTLDLLSDPATLNALNRLLSRSELIVFLVESLDTLLQRGDVLTDNLRSSLQDMGLGSPEASATIIRSLEALAIFLPAVPTLLSVAPKFIEIIERLQPFVSSPEFDALLKSGVFHTDTVNLVGRAGDAFVESYDTMRMHDRKLGPIGLLLALNDPDVQRILALLVSFSRRFGRSLA